MPAPAVRDPAPGIARDSMKSSLRDARYNKPARLFDKHNEYVIYDVRLSGLGQWMVGGRVAESSHSPAAVAPCPETARRCASGRADCREEMTEDEDVR